MSKSQLSPKNWLLTWNFLPCTIRRSLNIFKLVYIFKVDLQGEPATLQRMHASKRYETVGGMCIDGTELRRSKGTSIALQQLCGVFATVLRQLLSSSAAAVWCLCYSVAVAAQFNNAAVALLFLQQDSKFRSSYAVALQQRCNRSVVVLQQLCSSTATALQQYMYVIYDIFNRFNNLPLSNKLTNPSNVIPMQSRKLRC